MRKSEKTSSSSLLNKTAAVLFALFFIVGAARAATFTVNSINDEIDVNTADNICETAAIGECTLRAAIEQANATAGADTINFNIAPFNNSLKTITPASPLPSINDIVILNGYSQPNSSANTLTTSDNAVILIELSGTNAGAGANGLTITGNNSTISGLAINRFSRVGISLSGGDNNIIAGNFIGTDAGGLIDFGNGSVGIYGEFASQSNGNLIGGMTPAARNIISGNGNAGILFEFQAINNVVQGNFVGLAADGTSVLANNSFGIGFGSFTARTYGTFPVLGSLSDGTPYVSSTFAGPLGEVLVYQAFGGSLGSACGSMTIVPGTAPGHEDNLLSGSVSWSRAQNLAATMRVYKKGFAPFDLSALGGRYLPPQAPAVFLNLADDGSHANAEITFAAGGIESSIPTPKGDVRINGNNQASFLSPNPRSTSLVMNLATGQFSGTFSLRDTNPWTPRSNVLRSATYQGLAIRDATGLAGYGYFLLPQMPASAGETVTQTPILSGQVILKAK